MDALMTTSGRSGVSSRELFSHVSGRERLPPTVTRNGARGQGAPRGGFSALRSAGHRVPERVRGSPALACLSRTLRAPRLRHTAVLTNFSPSPPFDDGVRGPSPQPTGAVPMSKNNETRWKVVGAILVVALFGASQAIQAQHRAQDPGVRGGPAGAGEPIVGLSADELDMFKAGLTEFSEEDGITEGVGPRFNFVSCAGCRSQAATGGTRPVTNPLFRVPAGSRFAGNVGSSVIPSNRA